MEVVPTCDFVGVYFADAQWQASASICHKRRHIGSFNSPESAAVARDMELLRYYGEDAADQLNFGYDIDSSTNDELVVVDGAGVKIHITLERGEEYASLEPDNNRKEQSREVMTASIVLPKSWPSLSCNHQPWADRTQTASLISAAFAYDITFPFQSALGLNLKPHSIMYSQAGGGSSVGCLTVVDAIPALAVVIKPGDILLRVNETDLIMPGNEFVFENATKAITSAPTPRTLRLMRPYCPGILPCPAEMFLLAHAQSPSATFTVVMKSDISSEKSLQLTYMDQQVPAAVSRQLQAPEIVYNVCVMPKPPVKPPKIVSSSKSSTVRRDIVNGEKTYIAKGTIYRERIHSAGGPGAGAFANGGGPPPNGGGLMNSVQGGLMISNSCVISLGKWCAYIQIDTVENYITPAADIPQAVDGFGFSSSADDSEKAKSKVALSQYWHSTPRRFFVGKFDSELEAKVNMDMASDIATTMGTFSAKLLSQTWQKKRLKDAPPVWSLPAVTSYGDAASVIRHSSSFGVSAPTGGNVFRQAP